MRQMAVILYLVVGSPQHLFTVCCAFVNQLWHIQYTNSYITGILIIYYLYQVLQTMKMGLSRVQYFVENKCYYRCFKTTKSCRNRPL